MSVKYRLGIQVYPAAGPCVACGDESDPYRDYGVGCRNKGKRIYRYNILRDALHMTAKQASLSPAKEESALLPGSAEKPADVFIPGWANGRDAALDVSVVSPLQSQLIKKASEESSSAAKKRNNDMLSKYFDPCNNEGIHFFPVVVETLGGWHTKLARQLASQSGAESADTARHLLQRLGILPQYIWTQFLMVISISRQYRWSGC